MTPVFFSGQVWHQRLKPRAHQFRYAMDMLWLPLNELADGDPDTRLFRVNQPAWVSFYEADYLPASKLGLSALPQGTLQTRALHLFSQLANQTLHGEVVFVGQPRMLGIYFSPINLYYLRQHDDHFSHMMAEVSNTPWSERQLYLVALNQDNEVTRSTSDKAMHVSPFNPMDMTYHWRVEPPNQHLKLEIHCYRAERIFAAGLHLVRQSASKRRLWRMLLATPSMPVKTLAAIYWQALKIWLKGVPVIQHPKENPHE